MPDIPVIAAVTFVIAVLAVAAWRPEPTVLVLGVFLFVQSAVVRVESVPDAWRMTAARLDEIVLLGLVLRFAVPQFRARRFSLPASLWALGAFIMVGITSALVNGVPVAPAGVGLFLAAKGGLWLYVALNLRYHQRHVLRYLALLGALFVAAVVLAVVQFAGATLPWEPIVRRSGELAATSIWNQHTVFGSALAVAAALSVTMYRLPGWRWYAIGLALATATGVLLSTVRRVIVSLPFALAVVVRLLPKRVRRQQAQAVTSFLRRPVVLGVLLLLVVAGLILTGPRMMRIAFDTWDEYVVHAGERDRYELYRGGFELALDSPLVGRGPGTYASFASVLFDSPAYAEVDVSLPASLKMGAPYASILAEFGFLGIASFAAFVALVLRDLIPIIRDQRAVVSRALGTGGMFLLADMIVESVVHVTFSDSFVAFFAFGAAGAAVAIQPHEASDTGRTPTTAPERRWLVASATLSTAIVGSLILVVAALHDRAAGIDERPNIVVIEVSEATPQMVADLVAHAADSGEPDGITRLGEIGTTFRNGRAAGTSYSASLASLLTGRAPSEHGVVSIAGEEFVDDYPGRSLEGSLLPDWMAASGYRTAFVGRYFDGYGVWEEPIVHRDGHWPDGWDFWRAIWGRPSYYHYRLNENGEVWGRGGTPEEHHTNDLLTDVQLVYETSDNRPLLLLIAPLAPATAPRSHFDPDVRPVPARIDDGRLRDATPGMASDTYIDRLEALLGVARLAELVLENTSGDRETYVFFTSATGLPDATAPDGRAIPFIVAGPGFAGGGEDPRRVTQADLAATILRLSGVEAPDSVTGRALVEPLQPD